MIESYSRIHLLHLCTQVHFWLPREIRDYIYRYLLDRLASCGFRAYLDADNLTQEPRDPHSPVISWTAVDPARPVFYEDSNFVGQAFARELIEMYYRNANFYVSGPRCGILDTFLKQDPFGYGLPVHQVIRSLEVCFGFDSLGMGEDVWAVGHDAAVEKVKAYAIELRSWIEEKLEALVRIEGPCKIKFYFCIWDGAVGLVQFRQIAMGLAPVVSGLQRNGCVVEMLVKRYRPLTDWGDPDFRTHWTLRTEERRFGEVAEVSLDMD